MYKHWGWHAVGQRTHNSSQGLLKMMHLVFACRAVGQHFYVSRVSLIFSPFKLSINYTITLKARNILITIFYTLVIIHQEPHINTVFDSGAGTQR